MKSLGWKPLVAVVSLALLLSACSATGSRMTDSKKVNAAAAATISVNVDDGQSDVPVDTRVQVSVTDGTLDSVTMTAADGTVVPGTTQGDGSWLADQLLDPGVSYTLDSQASNSDDKTADDSRSFTAQSLDNAQLTFATVIPGEGQTVGVGMPIIVQFDLPVTDKAAFERNMHVVTPSGVVGSWNWISDTTVHWRPQAYWPANTPVTVEVDTKSVNAGDGIYGQNSVTTNFTIGNSVVSTVDVNAHTMSVSINGQVARVIPVTTGAPGTASRNGTKIIMEKYTSVRMDGATVGYAPDDPNYYNIDNVQYAMRLTNSGEFVHAAPWSAWAQGNSNVSHACVGMSVSNAQWLFSQSNVGDVVEFTGSSRVLEPNNGWTDWNVPWETWQQGSALWGQTDTATPTATTATS